MARRKKSTGETLMFGFGLIFEIIFLIFQAFDSNKNK